MGSEELGSFSRKLPRALAALWVSVALISASGSAFAETTIKIASQGVVIVDVENYELGEGTTAQLFHSRFVDTGTGGDTAGLIWTGDCYGLGEVTATTYGDNTICVAHMSDTDSYSSRLVFNTDGWDWVVISGTGKYVGATGSGHITSVWGDTRYGDRFTVTDEGTITLK